MKHAKYAVALAVLFQLPLNAENPTCSISHSAGVVSIEYPGEIGRCYEIWASTDLASGEWTGPLDTRIGAGRDESVRFRTPGFRKRFFQLRASDLAPEPSQFAGLVVGTTLPNSNYLITSPTRFSWFGETGNWAYSKTAKNTGQIILTYDSNGNNASQYREVVLLTFETRTSGTYDYCEFIANVCDPSSVAEDIPWTF